MPPPAPASLGRENEKVISPPLEGGVGGGKESIKSFGSFENVLLAYDMNVIGLKEPIRVRGMDEETCAGRILFNQTSSTESNVVRPNFAKRAMAMAASIAFVFGLLVGQVNWGNIVVSPAQASLADTAIKHVIDEKPFVEHLDENVASSQINAKMMPFDHQLGENFPYHVYYLNHCGFGKSNALHMVFQGKKGKVTLFLTGIASDKTVDFEEKGMAGVVEPVGQTSLILVGEEGEDVAKIAENLMTIIKPMS